MLKTIYLIITVSFILCLNLEAQTGDAPFALNTIAEKRVKEYRNLVNNSINKNLSLDLTENTEENWQAAFAAMELLLYRSPWSDNRLRLAFDSIEKRTMGFQRAALELVYTLQNRKFEFKVHELMIQTSNIKIFAMCAEYLLLSKNNTSLITEISKLAGKIKPINKEESGFAIIEGLLNRLQEKQQLSFIKPDLKPLLEADYLKGNVIIYSFQRKNRDFPGIVLVRNNEGKFITDEAGSIFSVPQLARSISNLPGYLTNGNTPQGIFRMDGFAVSQIPFIGPTENIQLTMPNEYSAIHFMKDSALTDSSLSKKSYSTLIPESLKDYQPMYESYLAGKAGRTEIIAHGTTVNPEYYRNKSYYPFTPTQGCLATKEIWSNTDGKRLESDQQKLVDAIKVAGGADGYCIVIEIDDLQKPVSIDEILPYLKKQ